MNEIYTFLEKNADKIRHGIFGIMGLIIVVSILTPIVKYFLKPAMINVYILPEMAVIKIDGQEYRNGVYELNPGNYTGEISADGYKTKKVDFSVRAHDTVEISNYLLCEDETFDCYRGDTKTIMAMKDQNIDQAEYEFARDYLDKKDKYEGRLISDVLPYENYNQGFSARVISESNQDEGKMRIRVELMTCIENRTSVLKENFLTWIKMKDIKSEDYEILYFWCDGKKKL